MPKIVSRPYHPVLSIYAFEDVGSKPSLVIGLSSSKLEPLALWSNKCRSKLIDFQKVASKIISSNLSKNKIYNPLNNAVVIEEPRNLGWSLRIENHFTKNIPIRFGPEASSWQRLLASLEPGR